MVGIMLAVSGAEATQGWAWPILDFEPETGGAMCATILGWLTCWRRTRASEEQSIWLAGRIDYRASDTPPRYYV